MKRLTSVALVVLFGLSAWFRASSLDSLPDTDGDEAWHAIQLVHMMRGEPASVRTEHGLPLSPIHALLELPLLLAFKPSYALLRVPPLLTGLLAVFLIGRLGSRMFDRATGLIASALLAVLPVAIIFSRTGYESSHAPLYGVLILWCAYEHRVAWLSVLLGLCYFIHPTNIFLLPVVLAVMSFRMLRGAMPPPRDEVRSLCRGMAVPAMIVAAIGIFTLLRPTTERLSAVYHLGLRGSHDFPRFLALFGRLFSGTGRTPRPFVDLATWALLGLGGIGGAVAAIRRRRWDVIALFAGLSASLFSFFVVGGSDILQPGMTRYGLFLVVPTVLLISPVVSFLLVRPVDRPTALARHAQIAFLLAVAFSILLSVDLRRLTNQVMDAEPAPGESIWTFGRDLKDSRRLAIDWIAGQAGGEEGASSPMTVVIAPDFMTRRSLQYLALSRRRLKVVEFHALGGPDQVESVMTRQIRGGAFVVLPPGHALEPAVRWLLSPFRYEAKEIRRGDRVAFVVYRPIVGRVESASRTPPPIR